MLSVFLLIACAAAAASAGPAVQLVAPDSVHHEVLVLQPEGLKALEELPADVAVVAVIGPLHSGKSFLVNQLRGATAGFELGPTVHPKTQGLWLWNEVLSTPTGQRFVLLDTEGFYASNVSSTYDAKIFSIATLLSSQLVYNSIRIIDMAALESLELLGRRAELFMLRAQQNNASAYELSVAMPSLHWVVRDFFQDIGTTCTEWLTRLASSERRDEAGPHVQDTLSLSQLFPKLVLFGVFGCLPAQ